MKFQFTHKLEHGTLQLHFERVRRRGKKEIWKLYAEYALAANGTTYRAIYKNGVIRRLSPILYGSPKLLKHLLAYEPTQMAAGDKVAFTFQLGMMTNLADCGPVAIETDHRYNEADGPLADEFRVKLVLKKVPAEPAKILAPAEPAKICAPLGGGWLASSDPWAVYSRSLMQK